MMEEALMSDVVRVKRIILVTLLVLKRKMNIYCIRWHEPKYIRMSRSQLKIGLSREFNHRSIYEAGDYARLKTK